MLSSGSLFGQTLQIDSIKANYLEGFMDFIRRDGVELPEHTVIGIIGDKDLATHLEKLTTSNNRTRSIQIQQIDLQFFEDNTPNCNFDMIFIGSGQKRFWSQVIGKTSHCSTLLVGEDVGFINAGGSIEFLVIKNRLRFRVNNATIEQRGLKLSSKLLDLAID